MRGVERSYGRWIQECNSCDDITLVVVRFPVLSPAVAEQNGEWSSSCSCFLYTLLLFFHTYSSSSST